MSLRDSVYRAPTAHEIDRPRHGDLAEIRRSHCTQESGRVVQVMHDPHLAVVRCAHCGLRLEEWIVEVHSDDPAWQSVPGPWFYPIAWLKRIDPHDPLQYSRVRSYRYVIATPAQIKAANP